MGSLDSYCKNFLDKQKNAISRGQHQHILQTHSSQQRLPVTQNKAGNTSSISKVILCKQTAALAFWKAEQASEMAEGAKKITANTKE